MTVKNVLKDCLLQFNITQLTIIDGYKVPFSGELAKFTYDCDPELIPHRDELLQKPVEEKTINSGCHLFIFIKQPPLMTSEDFEPLFHGSKDW